MICCSIWNQYNEKIAVKYAHARSFHIFPCIVDDLLCVLLCLLSLLFRQRHHHFKIISKQCFSLYKPLHFTYTSIVGSPDLRGLLECCFCVICRVKQLGQLCLKSQATLLVHCQVAKIMCTLFFPLAKCNISTLLQKLSSITSEYFNRYF